MGWGRQHKIGVVVHEHVIVNVHLCYAAFDRQRLRRGSDWSISPTSYVLIVRTNMSDSWLRGICSFQVSREPQYCSVSRLVLLIVSSRISAQFSPLLDDAAVLLRKTITFPDLLCVGYLRRVKNVLSFPDASYILCSLRNLGKFGWTHCSGGSSG